MFLHGLTGLWLQKHGWRLQPGSEKVLHSGTRLEGDEPTRDKLRVTTRFVHMVSHASSRFCPQSSTRSTTLTTLTCYYATCRIQIPRKVRVYNIFACYRS